MIDVMTSKPSDPDRLAQTLLSWGSLARAMPPAWDGARIAYPLGEPGAGVVGKMLPGRGLYVGQDLRSLGITRPLPYVYELSRTQRLIDLLGSERGAISTYDGILAARCGGKGEDINLAKASITTVASAWSSLFRVAGIPGAGTYSNIPGGAAPDRTNVGALSLGLTSPTGGDKKYLLTFGYLSSSTIQMAILADLLVAADNIDSNSNASQTVNSTALTRYTSGAGVLMTFEVSSNTLGSTASNLTVTYTNQAGTGSRSTGAIALTTSAIASRILPIATGPFMQLQSGDYGVRSVQSVQLSTAMGTASRPLALNLYFPLVFIPGVANSVYAERDSTLQLDGITELTTAAGGVLGCLVLYVLTNSTSSGTLAAFLRTCAG